MNISRIAKIAIGCSIAYTVSVVIAATNFNPLNIELDFSKTGPFGDTFGPLNTAMATVAAISAVAAYLSQKDELERVRADSEREGKRIERRDFEATFFNLLSLFRETVKEIDIFDPYGRNPSSGRDAFRKILDEYVSMNLGHSSIKESYRRAYNENQDDLGHYFRIFYHILKFIDDAPFDNKLIYTRLLRATLSSAEMIVIALNCLHGGGREKLKPLVESFSMLHNIPRRDALNWGIISGFEPSAFGDRDMGVDES